VKRFVAVFALSIVLFSASGVLAAGLDVIIAAESDIKGSAMGGKVLSPGDYDGDGYREVFVISYDSNYVRVYEGGNPPSQEPQKIYQFEDLRGFSIFDDISGDGLPEVAFINNLGNFANSVDVYLSGPDFYSKTEPDVSCIGFSNHSFGGHISGEDTDADGDNELVVVAYGVPEALVRTRIFIYEAYAELDSIPDDTLVIDTCVTHSIVYACCLGDINGDGFADYASSAYGYTPSSVTIYYGFPELDSIPEHVLWDPWGDHVLGSGIIPLDDMNRDGYDDFLILCSWRPSLMYYGGDPFDTIPLVLQYGGTTANRIGDINHDGWDDIAVGYPTFESNNGILFIYYGYAPMDTIADIVVGRSDLWPPGIRLGRSICAAGDFDGDGIDDMAVGASTSFLWEADYGRLYVLSGSDTLPTSADDAESDVLPGRYNILKQNHPNPFNVETTIRYDLFGYSKRTVELSVFNVLGQRIRTLVSGEQSGGEHKVQWDGRDSEGEPVSSGVYFYILKADGQSLSKKMLLLK